MRNFGIRFSPFVYRCLEMDSVADNQKTNDQNVIKQKYPQKELQPVILSYFKGKLGAAIQLARKLKVQEK